MAKINEGKISPVSWGKIQRALNTIAVYVNESNFALVNLYRANEPKGIFTWAKILFPLRVGRGKRNFPPTFVLSTNPSLLKGLGV